MAIGISAGTTTYALARRLVDVPGLTVVTNSVPVADVLHRAGRTRPDDHPDRRRPDPVGRARRPVRGRRPPDDPPRPGLHGRPRDGPAVRVHDAERPRGRDRPRPRRRPAAGSSSSPTRSKWGVIGISSIARLDEADTLVTDAGLEPEAREIAGGAVRELLIAPDGVHRSAGRRGGPVLTAPDGHGAGRAEPSTAGSRTTPLDGARATPRPSTPSRRDPHRRYNPLLDEWVLVSADRTAGRGSAAASGRRRATRPPTTRPATCVPGNRRANGEVNPDYAETFVFTNDFAALRPDAGADAVDDGLLARRGRARDVPRHLLRPPPRPDARRDGDGGRPPRRRPLGGPDRGARRALPVGPGLREPRRDDGRLEPASARPDLGRRRRCRDDGRSRGPDAGAHGSPPTAGRCSSTTSTRRPAARGSSSRTTTGSPSSRSGRRGRTRRSSSPGRPTRRLPELDDRRRDSLAAS